MARTLRTDPPSSCVARLLDQSAAARAVSPATALETNTPASEPVHTARMPARTSSAAPRNLVKREFVLSPEADATLDRVVELCRHATRTRLSSSHVIRSMLMATRQALDALLSELSLMEPMRLPSNAPGRDAERDRFEAALASAFRNAMRHNISRE